MLQNDPILYSITATTKKWKKKKTNWKFKATRKSSIICKCLQPTAQHRMIICLNYCYVHMLNYHSFDFVNIAIFKCCNARKLPQTKEKPHTHSHTNCPNNNDHFFSISLFYHPISIFISFSLLLFYFFVYTSNVRFVSRFRLRKLNKSVQITNFKSHAGMEVFVFIWITIIEF